MRWFVGSLVFVCGCMGSPDGGLVAENTQGLSAEAVTLVDFQTDGDGAALVEWDAVTTQFSALGLDRVYLVGTSSPAVIAAPGGSTVAYANSCDGADVPDADASPAVSGGNQLTATRARIDGSAPNYGFEFAQAVSEVSLRTVDFGDCIPSHYGRLFRVDLVGYDADGVEVARGSTDIARYGGRCPDDGFVGSVSVLGAGIVRVETEGLEIDCAHAIDDLSFTIEDSDGDGVPDDEDQCLGSAPGEVVDGNGCTMVQLCDGPFANHGLCVSCIAHVSQDFWQAGLITRDERQDIRTDAANPDSEPCPGAGAGYPEP